MSALATGASPISIPEIRRLMHGSVIAPDEAGYDEARTLFYGGMDKRPAVIVRAADAEDVAQVISLARASGIELAVRSGGHSNAGHSVTEGGIVLNLGDLKALQIDAEARSAWAESGLTAGEYTTLAHAHGLATGFGDTGSVGLGGLTTGGGVGYLVRKYGLTIDDLLAAEIVTADGQKLHIDAQTNPDLFWAIRGGGGNFGVVTRFQYRLHELKDIFGGMLILPATPEVIADFIALAQSAPEELSGIANIMTAPPMPFLASEHHGKIILMAMLVYAGEPGAGEGALAPFRKLATPLADMLKKMPYPEIYPPEPEGYHPMGAGRNMFLDMLDRNVAAEILQRIKSSTASLAVTQLRVLGGAFARVPVDATAFAHRQSSMMAHVAALYERPEDEPLHEAWASDFAAALRQSDAGAYVNFIGDEGPERVHAAYPAATWKRLASIKRRYDPSNLFHLNQNIPPA
jgi:FAD/FMN-containing dehydrogenase